MAAIDDTITDINIEVKSCPDCGARFAIDSAFCPFDGIPLTTSTWDRAGDPRSSKSLMVGDGRYEVLEALGEGGMGTVYRVRHVTLSRFFAMKVLRRDLANDAGLAERFLREARATAAIKHPNVVAITDFGEMEDGVPYFVMELLEGETVATRIRARGSIGPRMAIRIAKQVAEGLAASHAANVIHRDLKPDNVFLVGKRVGKAAEDEIRIVDFGAAKIVGGSKLTRPGIVFGTPYYMSPEQASGQEIDGRADVYSLGILLYEMVTGRVPFEADTYMGVLTKHMFQAPTRPVPPPGIQLGELESVVMRALQKDPDQRYASMAAFSAALDAALLGRTSTPPQPHAPMLPARTVHMRAPTTADRIEQSVHRRVTAEAQRRRRMIGVIAFAAFATFCFGASLVMLLTSPPLPAPAPPPPPPPPTATHTSSTRVIVNDVASSAATTSAASSSSSSSSSSPDAVASDNPSTRRVPKEQGKHFTSAPASSPANTASNPPSNTSGNTGNSGASGSHDDFKDPWKH